MTTITSTMTATMTKNEPIPTPSMIGRILSDDDPENFFSLSISYLYRFSKVGWLSKINAHLLTSVLLLKQQLLLKIFKGFPHTYIPGFSTSV